ncbi:DUF5324 family protein [Streptomyces zagrosensis]|uniref:Nosiheptide resistance regulatory protein n=1 Tax=Streptomyces zagrosensis TaxID=1042984 RepID=A0A7W9Q5N7_9ACTN|nr:DUF5324 family protein [Streptomyces zagrosensis]MBB5934076.1 hypothetical protein [Streptomyces zagrosensis]
MTRKDSVRDAIGPAKESVRHAAEVVGPHASQAKDTAVQYAHEARAKLGPKVSSAAHQARTTASGQYHAHLAPRLDHARGALPPKVDQAAHQAAVRTRKVARQAADYTAPRVESAVASARAAAEPVRGEAAARGGAALAALRGQITAADVQRVQKKQRRRARRGKFTKRFVVLGLLAGGGYAAWKWWDKQANPDWLVEPPAATEVGDRATLTAVETGEPSSLDAEVRAKQADADAGKGDKS